MNELKPIWKATCPVCGYYKGHSQGCSNSPETQSAPMPTPETDAAIYLEEGSPVVSIDFARKLERERDEARISYLAVQKELIKTVLERDEAMKENAKLTAKLKVWRD